MWIYWQLYRHKHQTRGIEWIFLLYLFFYFPSICCRFCCLWGLSWQKKAVLVLSVPACWCSTGLPRWAARHFSSCSVRLAGWMALKLASVTEEKRYISKFQQRFIQHTNCSRFTRFTPGTSSRWQRMCPPCLSPQSGSGISIFWILSLLVLLLLRGLI